MKDPSAKRKTVQKKYDQTWKGTNVEKSESNRKEKTTGNETRTEDRTDRASREKTEDLLSFFLYFFLEWRIKNPSIRKYP